MTGTYNPYEAYGITDCTSLPYCPTEIVNSNIARYETDPVKKAWLETVALSGILNVAWLTSEAREWIKIPPVGREAKKFPSYDRHRNFFGVWKTDQPNQTVNSPRAQLQAYLEWPESPEYYKDKGANSTLALMQSKTYQAWNSALDFYVVGHKIAPADAITVIRRDDAEVAKATIELVGALPSGPVGLTKMPKAVAGDVTSFNNIGKTVYESVMALQDHLKKSGSLSEDMRKKLFPTEKERLEQKIQQELEAAKNMQALSEAVKSVKSAVDGFAKNWGLW
ncbi:MAG: hypothetical protein JNL98_29600 [Bryobacterales bacterium]|nr:hypothetical protein [Bryobacterales bacterium]